MNRMSVAGTVPGWWRSGTLLGDEPPSPALEPHVVCCPWLQNHGMAGRAVEGSICRRGTGDRATY